MTGMSEASQAQVRAAQPDVSTWLSANAGSGKTRVLTDRVARLLLQGVKPERILCLTYTKAAAMEMQNRLFQRLGDWAMKDDAALRAALAEVGVEGLTEEVLRNARTLFARAIEAPGGLKIQTIHSFCASVLRRFPLEAGITPGFTEMDERAQSRLLAEVLDALAEDPAQAHVIDMVAAHLSDDDGLLRLSQALLGYPEVRAAPWSWEAICGWAGIAPDMDEAQVLRGVFLGGEARLAAHVRAHLDPTNTRQAKLHRTLGTVNFDAPRMGDLERLEEVLLTGEKSKAPFTAKIDSLANKTVHALLGDDMEAMNALMARVETARGQRLALLTAQRTQALYTFAGALLPVYEARKESRGWLDFDDLIRRTQQLLSSAGVAQWVLFRLDGGIDHILVDEAQDTSPAQWDIVKSLAADFAAGQSARSDIERTIFVVGDKKQSIYSFQGADPEGFDRMRDFFSERLHQIGAPFQSEELKYSFRSAPPILSVVDAVAARAGQPGVGPDVEHAAFKSVMPGRVDLWPFVERGEKGDDVAWDDPKDLVSEDHHSNVLAEALAARIKAMLDAREPIMVEGVVRPVEAGDILILVQRRSPLFRRIIAAIKAIELPIAGVDRAQIAEPLAAQDLIALIRFLATPEDDLSLATVLRSPIGGWSEDALFGLAHPRKTVLWRALQDRAEEFPDTVAMLEDLRDKADYLRPYDLLERALVRHDARRRLIARLGSEAEDGIDAILAQALSYEHMDVPSLTGFVGWLDSGQVTVKRDLAQAKGQIRVMTVHGAKGLEAPVVILPDCAPRQGSGGSRVTLVQPGDGPVVWARSGGDITPVRDALDAREARMREEANRLLYVAMTRAENWLIVAASGTLGKEELPEKSWYAAVRDAMETLGPVPLAVPEIAGTGLRVESGDWNIQPEPVATSADTGAALPEWLERPAASAKRGAKARTPSDLGGAKVMDAPGAGLTEAQAMRRGRLVHLMLEYLPRHAAPDWESVAPVIAAREADDVAQAEWADALREAERVLLRPELEALFGPKTLAEVTVTGEVQGGPMLGIIDRLIVSDARVLAVDFKTNAVVPERPEAVPDGLLRQMGAYAALLAPLYPGREVETAILWTRTAQLMILPHDIVSHALKTARDA